MTIRICGAMIRGILFPIILASFFKYKRIKCPKRLKGEYEICFYFPAGRFRRMHS